MMKKPVFLITTALNILIIGCSKDVVVSKLISLKSSEKSLYHNDKYQIEAKSNTPILYSSEDPYHATVSKSGIVTAGYVGKTNIVLSNGNDTRKIRITVNPKSNLYPEPNLEFGILKNDLIAKCGPPDYETETGIAYYDYSYATDAVMYLFDKNNKLISTGVTLDPSYSSELKAFLTERYFQIDQVNLVFVNTLAPQEQTMYIEADLKNSSYWLVIYLPYSSIAVYPSKSLKKSTENEFFNSFLHLKK